MQNQSISLVPLSKQIKTLKKILSMNIVFTKTLRLLKEYDLPNWYLSGGAIPHIVWNYYHKFDLNYGISDFDIVYFNKNDLSKKTEEKIEKELREKYLHYQIEFDVKNEARTHLWYYEKRGKKIEPYTCTEDAIYTFPTTASAVGITLTKKDELEVFAPHGLTDLLGLVVRANKVQITKDVYVKKCQRWKKVWPKLTIIPWTH